MKDNPQDNAPSRMMVMCNEVRKVAAKCEPRDFAQFAELCRDFSPPLGRVVAMHAEAADGNSPDLSRWITHTFSEWESVKDMTPEEAAKWWMKEYAQS